MISRPKETKPDTANVSRIRRRTSGDGAWTMRLHRRCGRLGRRRRSGRIRDRRHPTREHERRDGDDEIDGGGKPEGPGDAELGNHPDAGDEGAGDGASRVARVEQRDLAPENGALRQRRLHDQRQRRTHQRRRHHQDGEREHEPDDADEERPVAERAVQAHVDELDCRKSERCRKRGDGDEGLDNGEGDERPRAFGPRGARQRRCRVRVRVMNAARTVLAAWTVTPKTSASRRIHRTW